MAMTPMEYDRGGWTQTTLSPASGSSAVSNYGTMYALLNTDLRLAQLIWDGNATSPTAGQYDFTLPSEYTPKVACGTPIRNGDNLLVRSDGVVRVRLSSSTWSGGSITYALAN